MPNIGDLIRSGRAFVALQWGFVLAVLAVSFFASLFLNGVIEVLPDENGLLRGFFQIASFVVSLLLTLGSTRIYLDIIDGKESKLADIFSQGHRLLQYLVASILFGLAVFLGILLLVVPGIYIALKYSLYTYALVDRPELSGIDALKESARLTEGIKWNLLVFSLAMVGINLLGFLALGIGLLYTIPVTVLAYTALYRSLTRAVATSSEAVLQV